jgi:superfamily II DNA or RNA helicase
VKLKLDKLRPHQHEPAKFLLERFGRHRLNCVDLSETGTGKTFSSAAVLQALGEPTLAIVPRIVVPQWHAALAHFEDKISVVGYEALRTGRTPFGTWDNTPPAGFKREEFFKCTICQCEVDLENFRPCPHHPRGIHCLETKKRAWRYGKFNFHPAIRRLVFDEAHRCAAIDSLNADMMMAARRQGIPTLALTATAACTPLQMKALGYLLGLHEGSNFYPWTRRFHCGKIPGMPGWHWLAGKDKQKADMEKINRLLIPERGVRVRVADIPNFPRRTVTSELYDIGDEGEVDKLYAEILPLLKELKYRAERDADAEHPLTLLLRARQRVELLKVPLMVEKAQDLIAAGNSVGIFVNFTATLQALSRLLKCKAIVDGQTSDADRNASVASFNADESRAILLNSAAGGVGLSLPDLQGDFPRHGIVSPPLCARTFIQLLGRFHRESSVTPCFYHVMLAAKTVEEKVDHKLQLKLNNLEALNDGDLVPI